MTLRIVCKEDPTTGLPRLEVEAGVVAADDLRDLEREVHRRFEQVVGSSDGRRVFELEQRHPRLPRYFRVTNDGNGGRCPTLILEPGEREVVPGVAMDPVRPGGEEKWPNLFLDDLSTLLDATAFGPSLRLIVNDMQAVVKKDPKKFAWILLAGYLHAGDAVCRHHQVAGPYRDAARALQARLGDSLPSGCLLDLAETPKHVQQ